MTTAKTGKKGSRVSQRKKRAVKVAKGLTVDDFDLAKNLNGREVDPAEGRETRLPIVLRGMRENRSIREIAFELHVHPGTVANDKKFILEEAWELRQDLMGLWMEEQLQQYEHMLSLLARELQIQFTEKTKTDKGEWEWTPVMKDGKPVLIVNQGVMDKMLGVMDKVNELKGLKQAPTLLGINAGDNTTFNLEQDSGAASELMDFLKSGKVVKSTKALV